MNMIPFDSGKVPASIAAMFGDTSNELVGNSASGGFPVISIKGKVFHIQRGDERTLVTKPGEDDPAASIEVVVIRANPNRSKVFYAEGYQEGEKSKPTCYSNSGVEPEADAQEPQAKKCGVCVHNQWGSRITSDGRKGKGCADSRRIAIATVDTPADPMLLRIPAASMKNLEEYGKMLAARGLPPQAVVTRVGFDYSVAHPALTFKPVGMIGDATLLADIKRAGDSEIVGQIIGTKQATSAAYAEVDEETGEIAAPAPAPVVEPAPAPAPAPKAAAPKPAAKPKLTAEEVADSAPTTKRAAIKVEAAEDAKASSLEKSIESMLDDIDFDD